MEKDFDISKKAGGVFKAIPMKYKVNVTENYLEIHLFWAGKGTCCIPKDGYYGPLIAAVHAASGNVYMYDQDIYIYVHKSFRWFNMLHCLYLILRKC